MITVKLAQLPGAMADYAVEEGTTVGQLLTIAEVTPNTGVSISVNGSPADQETVLSDNATVILALGAKGNS